MVCPNKQWVFVLTEWDFFEDLSNGCLVNWMVKGMCLLVRLFSVSTYWTSQQYWIFFTILNSKTNSDTHALQESFGIFKSYPTLLFSIDWVLVSLLHPLFSMGACFFFSGMNHVVCLRSQIPIHGHLLLKEWKNIAFGREFISGEF